MKKILSLMLSLTITASAAAIVPSNVRAAATEEEGIISLVKGLGIMQGDENGDMALDRNVSRAEFSKLAIAASPAKNTVALGLKISPYKDVPYTEWYAPYVKAAVSAGYVQGYLDATYRPNNTVTYEEAITIMLRLLGYADGDFAAAYPHGQIAKAQGLDMLDGVDAAIGEPLTRRGVMRLIYNTLRANLKSDGGVNGALLSAHDCAEAEDVDIIATAEQDGTLGTDKVFTSAGTYTKSGAFNDNTVGMTGTAFIKNARDIIAFVPDTAASDYETYFVYSTLASSVVGYADGSFETINIPDSTTVYKNRTATTYAAVKGGMEMGDTLYLKRTNGGSIDYITYTAGTMEGPIRVTDNNALSNIGATASSTVMRDGARVNASAILANDIIYYSEPLDMVFAYSNKITGVYENAAPTKDSPVRVTISGIDYEIEGMDAFNALSSSGSMRYGDTVTICLGKDGGAAGVIAPQTTSAAVVGYVTDAGKRAFTDNSTGREYSSHYITLATPEGASLTYETASDRKSLIGAVCTVTVKDGKASASRTSGTANVFGTLSSLDFTIGASKLAQNVSILDVSNDNVFDTALYKKIYPQRLDGVTLKASQVLYSAKNAVGEITALILDNVTGDVYTYGTVNSSSNGSYEIDINGSVQTYRAAFTKAYYGPARLYMRNGTLAGISELSAYSGSVSELTETCARIGSEEYALSSNVVCYVKGVSETYRKTTLDDAIRGGYRLTAYYDKKEESGGRIRIIVCSEH